MKIAIMQPYFMPYIGYWQLLYSVDTFVIFDDVHYINKGWINRNNILVNGSSNLFTISLKEASQNKLINQIEIADDFSKFLKTIEMNYKKSPYFSDVYPVIQSICDYPNKNLAAFVSYSIQTIANYLELPTTILRSSSIQKKTALKAEEKIIDICKQLHATTYINAIGGKELYAKQNFEKENIELQFLKTNSIIYSQFRNSFVPWLSIIDVLMFNSKQDILELLQQFEIQ